MIYPTSMTRSMFSNDNRTHALKQHNRDYWESLSSAKSSDMRTSCQTFIYALKQTCILAVLSWNIWRFEQHFMVFNKQTGIVYMKIMGVIMCVVNPRSNISQGVFTHDKQTQSQVSCCIIAEVPKHFIYVCGGNFERHRVQHCSLYSDVILITRIICNIPAGYSLSICCLFYSKYPVRCSKSVMSAGTSETYPIVHVRKMM